MHLPGSRERYAYGRAKSSTGSSGCNISSGTKCKFPVCDDRPGEHSRSDLLVPEQVCHGSSRHTEESTAYEPGQEPEYQVDRYHIPHHQLISRTQVSVSRPSLTRIIRQSDRYREKQEYHKTPQIDFSPPDKFRKRAEEERTDTETGDVEGDGENGDFGGDGEGGFDAGVSGGCHGGSAGAEAKSREGG